MAWHNSCANGCGRFPFDRPYACAMENGTMSQASAPSSASPIDWRSPADLKTIGKALLGRFKRDRVTTQAAAVAFASVYALPAMILLIVLAAAVVDRATDVSVTDHLRTMITDHAPANTEDLLNEQVDQAIVKVGGGQLSVGILVTAVIALWSGSAAIGAMMAAFNLAFEVEENRSFPRQRLTSIGLTLVLAVSINVAFALLVFGQRIGSAIADKLDAGSAFNTIWNLVRLPAAIIAVELFLALLYWAGPNLVRPFRWITPGSAAATVLWLIATAGFGFFLRFSNPGSAYGVVGSVLVLLFFLYISSIVFILGAEIDAVLAPKSNPNAVDDLATHPDTKVDARIQEQKLDA